MAKLLLGFDQNGRVFDAGDVIRRHIEPRYKGRAAALFRSYQTGALDRKGIIQTTLLPDGDLEHRKLIVSYPYEWPANMYKDAVLFHLRLFSELRKAGLALKDALPNNILFDHTEPVFVDFLSLVPLDRLKEEAWLDAAGYADPRFAVLNRMFFRYMLLPLLFFARAESGLARELLSVRSCNCEGRPPSWRELLSPPPRRAGWISSYLRSLLNAVLPLATQRKAAGSFDQLTTKLLARIEAMDVTPSRSAYSSYYDEKKEALSLSDTASFMPKQKSVLDVLTVRRPASVLDIGANTGWYSNLAEREGASVIALEEDESCIDILYRTAKANGRRILPLRASFADLGREIYGAATLASEYGDRAVRDNPLYRAGIERLGADLVLVLGLLHHLVLGQGRTVDEVIGVLSKLARKTLVLEFVSLDDEKILTEPGFFGNLRRFDASTYSLDAVLRAGRRYFSGIEILASHPATRSILIFDR